jgi:hypothetical protein
MIFSKWRATRMRQQTGKKNYEYSNDPKINKDNNNRQLQAEQRKKEDKEKKEQEIKKI